MTGLSPQARERIGAQLSQLRQRRDQLLRREDEANIGADDDEAEGMQLTNHLGFVERRITELEELLRDAEYRSDATATLPDGAEVTVRFSDGETVTMRVVSVVEQIFFEPDNETLTADSPLGLALVGRRPGDTVTFLAPHGQQQVEVVAVKLPK